MTTMTVSLDLYTEHMLDQTLTRYQLHMSDLPRTFELVPEYMHSGGSHVESQILDIVEAVTLITLGVGIVV